ncbi:MAG: OmpH family outer membrane protein [Pseudomonadota bacterium]
MKRFLSMMLIVIGLIATPLYAAQTVKMAVVSLEQILQNSKYAESLNADLRKQFQPRQSAINDAQRKLQDEVDKYTFNSFSMTPDDRGKLQATINADKTGLDQMVAAFQKDYATAQAQAQGQFLKKLGDVINKIGANEHYDIIERAANILYINGSVDITKQVIDSLNSAS